MVQNDSKQMRSLALALRYHTGALTKIHLRFGTRLDFHPRERDRLDLPQVPHEPFDRLITVTEPVLTNQVLINALRAQSDRQSPFNLRQPRLAKTLAAHH